MPVIPSLYHQWWLALTPSCFVIQWAAEVFLISLLFQECSPCCDSKDKLPKLCFQLKPCLFSLLLVSSCYHIPKNDSYTSLCLLFSSCKCVSSPRPFSSCHVTMAYNDQGGVGVLPQGQERKTVPSLLQPVMDVHSQVCGNRGQRGLGSSEIHYHLFCLAVMNCRWFYLPHSTKLSTSVLYSASCCLLIQLQSRQRTSAGGVTRRCTGWKGKETMVPWKAPLLLISDSDTQVEWWWRHLRNNNKKKILTALPHDIQVGLDSGEQTARWLSSKLNCQNNKTVKVPWFDFNFIMFLSSNMSSKKAHQYPGYSTVSVL